MMDIATLGTNIRDAIMAKLNALLPSQSGNSGKVLGTNGTALSWVANGGGTVFYTQAGVAMDGANGNFFIASTSTASSTIAVTNIAIGVQYYIVIKNTSASTAISVILPSTADVKTTSVIEVGIGKSKMLAMIFDGTTRYWHDSMEMSI
jgi:hypothetical protein